MDDEIRRDRVTSLIAVMRDPELTTDAKQDLFDRADASEAEKQAALRIFAVFLERFMREQRSIFDWSFDDLRSAMVFAINLGYVGQVLAPFWQGREHVPMSTILKIMPVGQLVGVIDALESMGVDVSGLRGD